MEKISIPETDMEVELNVIDNNKNKLQSIQESMRESIPVIDIETITDLKINSCISISTKESINPCNKCAMCFLLNNQLKLNNKIDQSIHDLNQSMEKIIENCVKNHKNKNTIQKDTNKIVIEDEKIVDENEEANIDTWANIVKTNKDTMKIDNKESKLSQDWITVENGRKITSKRDNIPDEIVNLSKLNDTKKNIKN